MVWKKSMVWKICEIYIALSLSLSLSLSSKLESVRAQVLYCVRLKPLHFRLFFACIFFPCLLGWALVNQQSVLHNTPIHIGFKVGVKAGTYSGFCCPLLLQLL
jgi:hypothetical protein